MRVISMRRAAPCAAGTIATFDAEVAPGVKVTRCSLKRTGAGELRVFGPRIGSGAVVFFNPDVSSELTKLAAREFERATRHAVAA